ncbi:MAG TPA: hypothetical protein VNK23_11915 [Candidatus Dormibacteraeota bacterium]|nr:hypothetical protein [Candidatus Dormibacteraeota bacterium]
MPLIVRAVSAVLALLLIPAYLSAQGPLVANTGTAQQSSYSQQFQDSTSAAPEPAPAAAVNSQDSTTSAKSKKDSEQQETKKKLPQAPQSSSSSANQPQQTKRLMWIVPNFAAVSPGVKFKPMTPKEKFWVATEDSFDYSSFAWTGVLAAQSYGLDQYPELGTGGVAYGRYYWRGMLDGISNSYFSEAIFPVLTHEDPRYFTMGRGGFFPRLGYALSRVVITYSDSGRATFNCGEVCGDFAGAALSTAYYPPQERGMVKISEGFGTQLESAALNNVAKEFWPDVRQFLFHRH